ncbi:MAG: hypothetical protein WCT53_00705 [Candidatus Gracilibacteria bacterium]
MAPQEQEQLRKIEDPKKSPDKDVGKLRDQYKDLLENEKKAMQGESGKSYKDRKTDVMSKKDLAAVEKWINSPDSQDAAALKYCIDNFEKGKQSVKRQVDAYKKQLEDLAKKGEFSKESISEYLKWFHEDLNFQEREQYLSSKNTDAQNPARAKTLHEANDLFKFFTNPASKKAAEDQRKLFDKKDLQGRQKEVEVMKTKRKLLEDSKLPHVVRESLKGQILQLDASATSQTINKALDRHKIIKARFLKLPRMVQAESTAAFKEMGFDQREKFLKETESKVLKFTMQYRTQIVERQRPDNDGLTLFSSKPIIQTGTSANSYMKWFENDLTLAGMAGAVSSSDLQNPERRTVCDTMRKQLPKIPGKMRAAALKEFNEADLDERKTVIIPKWEEKCKKMEANAGEGNIVHRLLRKIMGTSANEDVQRPMEAWAVMNEITKEKRRNSQRLGHSAKTNVAKEAAEKGETASLDRTQKIIGAVHDEKLKTQDGKLKLKADTMMATPGAVQSLKRTLKQVGIDDSNKAQIAGDVLLVTQAGVVITEEREFITGELQRQLGSVRKKVAPVLQKLLVGEGVNLDDKQLDAQLKTADWEEMGKEKIRRAA